jgi:hypothetical protein
VTADAERRAHDEAALLQAVGTATSAKDLLAAARAEGSAIDAALDAAEAAATHADVGDIADCAPQPSPLARRQPTSAPNSQPHARSLRG